MSRCQAHVFQSEGRELVGILHEGHAEATRGIVIVTGGPQYRVGSHRQFVLIARHLASEGYPVLRFDYRGMGDSEGELTDFKDCDADITEAVQVLRERAGVRDVVLWGLCDAASAIMMRAARHEALAGIVLLNPWARSDIGIARTYLRHYYVARVFSKDFWYRLLTGRFRFTDSISGLLSNLSTAFRRYPSDVNDDDAASFHQPEGEFRDTMRIGLDGYAGPVLLILSGADLTAKEFVEYTHQDRRWRKILERPNIRTKHLDGADHTFSKRVFRDRVAKWTVAWLQSW